MRNATSQITRNTKNSIFAIPTAAPASPPKPRTAAINAKTKKTSDQCSICYPPGARCTCPYLLHGARQCVAGYAQQVQEQEEQHSRNFGWRIHETETVP